MRPSAVMCLEHWARVPIAYQRQVHIRGRRVASAVNGSNPRALISAMRLYRLACSTAVHSVRAKLERVAGAQAVLR
jgi:hypothetical protein